MLTSTTSKNRILILEEQRIIGFDLEQQLRKRGYCVSYQRSYEDIQQTFLFGLSEIVISSLRSLQTNPGEIKAAGLHVVDSLIDFQPAGYKTDTIIVDPEGSVRHFEKPYKIEDIVTFIGRMINISNPEPRQLAGKSIK